jgi:hypothetical protein
MASVSAGGASRVGSSGVRALRIVGLGVSVVVCLLASGCGASDPANPGSRPPLHVPSEPVRFLPGGKQVIARGRVTGAAGFSIRAERYRFQHRTYFNLAVNVAEIGGGSQGTNFTPEPSKPFSWSTEQGCSPAARMWTIVFGVLANPTDLAYASTTHGRYRLWTATIPPRFRTTGVAAYVSLREQPIRVLVTTRTGRTLMREQLEPAPPERCQPGTAIMLLRKQPPGTTGG